MQRLPSRVCTLLAAFTLVIGAAGARASDDKAAPQRRTLPTAEERAKLPPDGGPDFNRLVFEQSPYLLQHATNPVDWYPWGPAAFARAKELKRPIFLSIGYSTCHWCHVMERESFEDAQVAAYLNEHFVAIKVDREERPDVDDVYIAYCTAMTGSAGWPLTIVATPEAKPFFAGTYFPKADENGRPGLTTVLEKLAGAWNKEHELVLTHAEQLLELVRQDTQHTAGDIDARAVTERAVQALAQEFDKEHGGFGGAPKFPMTSSLRLLLRWSERTGDGQAQFHVDRTLDALACGGIHDHLDGGFHRYTTDREWIVPHFEKMLYDQALLALTFCEAFEKTRKPEWSAVAQRTLAYALARLGSPAGGFWSAEDADSGGEEGAFYLWTRAELCAGAATCPAAEIFRVTATSSAAELKTRVLHLVRPYTLPDVEIRLGDKDLVRRSTFVAALAELRAQRVRPARDEKILTDWNGLMIGALARTGRATGNVELTAAAVRAANFALANLRRPDGRLWKRSVGGAAAIDGVLDDSAYLAWGLLELYQADGDPRWLREAIQVTDMFVGQFRDDAGGGFFRAARSAEKLVMRTQATDDSSLPSAYAIAVQDLVRLARFTGVDAYETHARTALRACAQATTQDPIGHAEMLAAHDLLLAPSLEIVIAGPRRGADTAALLARVHGRFLPNAVLLLRATDDPKDELATLAPWTKDLGARGGVATAYVCRGHVCSAPTTDPAELARLLEHPYAETAAPKPALAPK